MKILEHQQEAFDEIIARATAYYSGRWKGLDLDCRWNTLIVGGTGTGKSTLATLASQACSAVPLRIATPGYVPCSAHNRGANETITVIAEHVAKHPRTFLIYDELEKLCAGVGGGAGSAGSSDTWQSYIRGEILEISDRRWPIGMNLPEIYGRPDITIEELTTKLKETVYILGIGTFQSALDSASQRTIGFSGEQNPATDVIRNETVTGLLGRELGNRFHSELLRLPELRTEDYHRMAREAENKLPERMRELFRQEIAKRITEAVANKKSVRFLEEALTATIMKLPAPMPSNHLSLTDL
jgi:SpoVK/Ycf46/Vps4 family AAA+-type ATPase